MNKPVKDVDWDLPETYAALYHYYLHLMLENTKRSFASGEMIPLSVVTQQLCAEYGFEMNEMKAALFAGEMIAYDRQLAEMTPEEYQQHMEERERAGTFLDSIAEHMGFDSMDDLIEDANARNEEAKREIEDLNNLFGLS